MKKYKCIKAYPGVGEGEIVTAQPHKYYQNTFGKIYSTVEIESFPEFWKRIYELEVPIGTKFYALNRALLHNTIYTINKIDKNNMVEIRWNAGQSYYHIDTVNKCLREGIWKKYNEKIPTTEDGVDIYEGDELWWVAVNEDPDVHITNTKWDYNKYIWDDGNKNYSRSSSKNYKWFSSEEKALEYIKYNKPLLSYEEVMKLFNSPSHVSFRSRLQNLVEINYGSKNKQ